MSTILKKTIIKSKIDHGSFKYVFSSKISPNDIIFIIISTANIDVIKMFIYDYPG